MKKPQPNKTIETEDTEDALFPDLRELDRKLSRFAKVFTLEFDIPMSFSVAFRQIFMGDQPNYELKKGVFGATRSNWTYHTALAIANASRMLNMTCRFEALGKRDAIIETQDEPPLVVVAAEWEWDFEDVFGEGKEIDKLIRTCKAHDSCHGFLLVYCPADSYVDYVERVVAAWIENTRTFTLPPTLFLHTIVFIDRSGMREFDRLRTLEVHPERVVVWNDLLF